MHLWRQTSKDPYSHLLPPHLNNLSPPETHERYCLHSYIDSHQIWWNIQSRTDRRREIYWFCRTQSCDQGQYEVIDNVTVNGAQAAGSCTVCMKNCRYTKIRPSSPSEHNLCLSYSYNLSYLTRGFTCCFICWLSNQNWDCKIDLVAAARTGELVLRTYSKEPAAFSPTESIKKHNLRLDFMFPTWQGILSTTRATRYWPGWAENLHLKLRKGMTHPTNIKQTPKLCTYRLPVADLGNAQLGFTALPT